MDLFEHSRRTLTYLQDATRKDLMKLRQHHRLKDSVQEGAFILSKRLRLTLSLLRGDDYNAGNRSENDFSDNGDFLDYLIDSLDGSVPPVLSNRDLDDMESAVVPVESHCWICKHIYSACLMFSCSVCLREFCYDCFGFWNTDGLWKLISKLMCKIRHACPNCQLLVSKQRQFHQKMVLVLETGITNRFMTILHPSHTDDGMTPVPQRQTQPPLNTDPLQADLSHVEMVPSGLFFDFDRNLFIWRSTQLNMNRPLFEYLFSPSDVDGVEWQEDERRQEYYVTLELCRAPSTDMADSTLTQSYLAESSLYPSFHKRGLAPLDYLKYSYVTGVESSTQREMELKMNSAGILRRSRSCADPGHGPDEADASMPEHRCTMHIRLDTKEEMTRWRDAIQSACVILVPR